MNIERGTKPQRREIARYKETRNLASTPEEAVYRSLFPGRDYIQRTNEQMDKVQEWIEAHSPGWNAKD